MNRLKRFICLLSASVILVSAAGCNSEKPSEAATQIPVQSTTAVAAQATETKTVEETLAETTVQETTSEVSTTDVTETAVQETTTKATETTKTSTKPATTKTPETTKTPAKTTTTKAPATTAKQITVPVQKSDIVKLYNTATAAASTAKPGYSKSTKTTLSNLDMGALSKIGAVREAVGGFLGEGESSSTVKKGSFDGKSLVKSTLKESDVTNATCKLSSDKKYYIVTITVKNETNPLKGSSALGRFTKDYKDVAEIKKGLAEAGASLDSITVKTNGVTINAKISIENNRFVSLSHNIKMNAMLTNVKYSIAKVGKATASLETTVNYTNFKY